MAERKKRIGSFFSQLLLVLMGIVLLSLAASFARQVKMSQQRRHELEALEQRIHATLLERAELDRTLQETQSDAATEKWARAQGWVRTDQVLVVPVREPAAPPVEEQMVPEKKTVPESPQESWWDLFFGSR